MKKKAEGLLGFVALLFLVSGCAPLVAGGAAVGTAGAGTYYFARGAMQTDYKYPFEDVWGACEKTLANMRAVDVQPLKEIGRGTINAVINDEKVQFVLSYRERSLTTVTVRVGAFGDKIASQMLQDKIEDNISKR
ncbi:MAG: DUF3568 family protein [Syntrophales bacterium]